MAIFLSTHINKLDKKGRVSVPASFRAHLIGNTFQGMVAFRSLSLPAIEGFGMARMERLSAQIDTLDPFSQDQDDLTASIFADAQALGFDGEGRILLPDALITYAQLSETVAFVGRGATFQLWSPPLFEQHQETARARLKTQRPLLAPLTEKGRLP